MGGISIGQVVLFMSFIQISAQDNSQQVQHVDDAGLGTTSWRAGAQLCHHHIASHPGVHPGESTDNQLETSEFVRCVVERLDSASVVTGWTCPVRLPPRLAFQMR